MDNRKLFQVLVIGGALLGVGCEREERPTPDPDASTDTRDASGSPLVDAATVVDATTVDGAASSADAALPSDDAGELTECGVCPNEECCVDDGAGGTRTRDGFVCCWGTSC